MAAFTLVRSARGEHMIKLGGDVLRASYTGTSASEPVFVRRADGTLSQRIDFSTPTRQAAASTDASVFAQDRWRVADRLVLELGLRLDRNGGIGAITLGPRAGAVLALLPEGRAILRGGAGLFQERTPLTVDAFTSFEERTVTHFASDGLSVASQPVRYANRVADHLNTPSGSVWNVEFDGRLPGSLFMRVNELHRDGRNEYVIDPIERSGAGSLWLSSSGRSRYHETELTLRYAPSDARSVVFTYVRSRSEADSNAFDDYFGNVRAPVIRPRQFSRGGVDVPNRLILQAIWPLSQRWTASALLEVRDGFPFTLIDEDQNYVSGVNRGGRFPRLVTLDLSILRTITFHKREVRLGFKGNHLLNNFSPRDVQANVDSAAFGTFYNSFPRRLGFLVQFSPK
jgi:hypothetical protein